VRDVCNRIPCAAHAVQTCIIPARAPELDRVVVVVSCALISPARPSCMTRRSDSYYAGGHGESHQMLPRWRDVVMGQQQQQQRHSRLPRTYVRPSSRPGCDTLPSPEHATR
jgi:hypothetical protein